MDFEFTILELIGLYILSIGFDLLVYYIIVPRIIKYVKRKRRNRKILKAIRNRDDFVTVEEAINQLKN